MASLDVPDPVGVLEGPERRVPELLLGAAGDGRIGSEVVSCPPPGRTRASADQPSRSLTVPRSGTTTVNPRGRPGVFHHVSDSGRLERGPGYRPALDGVRGVAILLVLGQH